MLGDDGRMFVSRVGTAEPLYGIGVDAQLNLLISTPGTMQEAVINTAGVAPVHRRPHARQPRPDATRCRTR